MVNNSPKLRHLRYEALRRSLTETIETWPSLYEHKIIGKNGDTFKDSLKEFEQQFPRLNRKQSNVSKNGTYLSLTYEIMARDVDEIISLWVGSESLKDFITIL
jgi:putative lipoic acid-binding regulatory protein